MDDALVFHVPRFRVKLLARPELRRDPILLDRWVIVSTERLGRPHELRSAPPTPLPVCPFCAGNEHLTGGSVLAAPDRDPWRVRFIPNAFPALAGNEPGESTPDGFFLAARAAGVHEVIIECPAHEARLARLPAAQIAILVQALADRMRILMAEQPHLYPLFFKNHGAAAGASLEHAHAQFMGLPLIPARIQHELDWADEYHAIHRRCVFCDMMKRERALGERVIFETPSFVVIAPYASRFPCEMWILPREHENRFEECTDLREFAEVYHRVLRLLDTALDDPPFNAVLHTAPFDPPAASSYHWHMEILPRITGIAGFECGTEMNINPVPPEQAAAYLRDVLGTITAEAGSPGQ